MTLELNGEFSGIDRVGAEIDSVEETLSGFFKIILCPTDNGPGRDEVDDDAVAGDKCDDGPDGATS
jgi:hypothetical protein